MGDGTGMEKQHPELGTPVFPELEKQGHQHVRKQDWDWKDIR